MLIGVILIFVIGHALSRNRLAGYVFWQFVLWYSILRTVMEEPFRDNPLFIQAYLNESAGIGLFTLTQLVSVPIKIGRASCRERASMRTGTGRREKKEA